MGPIIPEADAAKARAAANEQILVHFVPGSLLNCDTVGLDPGTVELLRDPKGAMGSTAPCVWRVTDRVRLETPPAVAPRPSLFALRPYLAGGYLDGGLEGGLGADLLHLGKWSLGADLRFARIGTGGAAGLGLYHVVGGVSYPVLTDHLRLQAGYGFALSSGVHDSWSLSLLARW